MKSIDTFYYVASIGVAVTVLLLGYLVYELVLTLKSLRKILDDVGETTGDITSLKNAVKFGFSNFGSIVSDKIRRGGVFNGKRKKKSR